MKIARQLAWQLMQVAWITVALIYLWDIAAELVRVKAIEKWDGVLPTYMGGGATPFINIDKK